jgi:hypothetical protein
MKTPRLHRPHLMVSGAVLALIGLGIVSVGYFPVPASKPQTDFRITTPDGLVLASIFENVPGPKLPTEALEAMMHAKLVPLQCAAPAPAAPVTSQDPPLYKRLWSSVAAWWRIPSVFAQCGPGYCSGHFMAEDPANCGGCTGGMTTCSGGGSTYEIGCRGELFQCSEGGECCGQVTCENIGG